MGYIIYLFIAQRVRTRRKQRQETEKEGARL